LFWPVNLTFSYPRWTIAPAHPSAYGWLVLGIGLGAAIYFTRRFFGRSVAVATLFYVATLIPLLGFVMLYTFRYTFVADHYQYVASLGLIALAAAGHHPRLQNQTLAQAGVWWGLAADAGDIDLAAGGDLPEPGNPLARHAG
jgi:hypothetical protein